jgi:hypothetical protein
VNSCPKGVVSYLFVVHVTALSVIQNIQSELLEDNEYLIRKTVS